MEQFPHLKFSEKIIGSERGFGGGETHPTSKKNKDNRQAHSGKLQRWIDSYKKEWEDDYKEREELNLALIDENIQPIFIQVNPDIINAEFDLESFGIEVISEEENGFIIGASTDGFKTLEQKIADFIESTYASGKIADFWEFFEGNRESWKPVHILSEYLYHLWSQSEIEDAQSYHVEVSVAFNKPMPKEPRLGVAGYNKKLEKYRRKLEERDELMMQRQEHFQEFISHYGSIESGFVELEDSFACEVIISGKGLRDLVVNYQFVFEVKEVDEVEGNFTNDYGSNDFDLETEIPDGDSPEIGIIDSGIMESHKYIDRAIKSANSKSYVDGDTSTNDKVTGGGHGTKVAGAVLYPNGVSQLQSPYKLPFFIRNIRVLNEFNELKNKFPALLMETIVEENEECKIFNLSINSKAPYRKKHMSSWAATIDTLTHEKKVLFINSVGNLSQAQIKNYLLNGNNYPNYLHEDSNRVANPSQSSFSIAVGSINHITLDNDFLKTIGNENEVSSFSKIGLGIWGKIKPDVVEYGGGNTVTKDSHKIVSNRGTSVELIRSTLNGGSAYSSDTIGTSFSTPKVTHIVGQLLKLYPNEDINLLRALVIQGARLPNDFFVNPTKEAIQYYGYGIPSLERVTKNTEYRATFYSTNEIKAKEGQLYSLKIPMSLRQQGDDYDILIEVSLAYTAKVRRTRQRTKSYLSTWLDWKSSKIDESYDDFKKFALKQIDNERVDYDKYARRELRNFKWKVHNRSDYGDAKGVNRTDSTVQKDWTIVKSYELPEELSFAIIGHKGWDKNKEEVPYAFVVSLEVLGQNIPIYEELRIENEIEVSI